MIRLARRIGLAILIALFFCSAATAEENDARLGAVRSELLDSVNSLRGRYQCGELKFDDNLNAAAQRQAEYLAEIGRLETTGSAGESLRERALDAGYGGEKSFTILETNAQVWVDTDFDYLIEQVWRKDQTSVRTIFSQAVRQAGIGIADAPDKHRYYVLTLAGLDDGTDDYSVRPTYDFRTPKPTVSSTPTPQALVTSTQNPDGSVIHIVQEGETFSEIALAYGLDWYTLSILNNVKLSDTTPVVIYEGQELVIQPTFTLTPTPTATKTPLPPTNTPRPTFTPNPNASVENSDNNSLDKLPAPRWENLIEILIRWERPIGWILVALCVPGIALTLKNKKDSAKNKKNTSNESNIREE